jgi:hypothetical protein
LRQARATDYHGGTYLTLGGNEGSVVNGSADDHELV